MELTTTGIALFGVHARWYGVLIALGIALAVMLAGRREKRLGLPRDTGIDLALWGVPAAIVGARLYYVLFSWRSYAANPIRALYVWEGGLAIYGGLLGGLAAGLCYARARKLPFLKLCDLVAPSFALGQAVGRWGNFFNQEAYGVAVGNPAWQRFPFAVFIQADGQWHLATFFYESVWCFGIVMILLILERKGRLKRTGDTFFTYGLLYGLERTIVEGLRTDSLYWGPVRVSQALSALVVAACAAALALRRGRNGQAPS